MSFAILEEINNEPEGFSFASKFNHNKINIAKVITGNDHGYIYLDNNKNKTVETAQATRLEPIIAYKGDRNLIYIVGPSGAGKSMIAAEFAKQYKVLNKTNKIYYCCSTDIKDDETWGELNFVKPIDILKIYSDDIDPEEEREMIKTLFSDSLIVFDDLDMLPKAQKKIMTRFQGKIVEIGRKYSISCIIISHIVCGGINTKMILNEANMFITWKSMITNNRMLKIYKGFKDDQLIDHKKITSSWICYNFRYNTIITTKKVIKI